MKFTFIDLFAGVGGFRIALQKSGGQCIAFSEIDKSAIEVYQNNFNTHLEKILGDITKVDNIPKSDVVVGGVPCQAWSVAGSKKGFDDPRGKLWKDCIRLVKKSKPRSFIFENVKGLYDPRNKDSLSLIISEFERCGYNVFHKLLNAYDFGLPQNRDRIFIVGIDKKNQNNFEFPDSLNSTKPLHKIFDDINFNKKHLLKKNFLPRDLFGERIPVSRNRFQRENELNDFFIFCDTRNGHSTIHSWDIRKTTKKEKNICMTILKNRRKKQYGEWDGNPLSYKSLKSLIPNLDKRDLNSLIKKKILVQEDDGRYELYHTKNSAGINGIYRIFLPQSEIFSTITATENRDYIATTSITGKDKEEYKKQFIEKIFLKKKFRLITGREAARLQGFPDNFKIHKNEKIAKKQFGNAVPINIVYEISKKITSIL